MSNDKIPLWNKLDHSLKELGQLRYVSQFKEISAICVEFDGVWRNKQEMQVELQLFAIAGVDGYHAPTKAAMMNGIRHLVRYADLNDNFGFYRSEAEV